MYDVVASSSTALLQVAKAREDRLRPRKSEGIMAAVWRVGFHAVYRYELRAFSL